MLIPSESDVNNRCYWHQIVLPLVKSVQLYYHLKMMVIFLQCWASFEALRVEGFSHGTLGSLIPQKDECNPITFSNVVWIKRTVAIKLRSQCDWSTAKLCASLPLPCPSPFLITSKGSKMVFEFCRSAMLPSLVPAFIIGRMEGGRVISLAYHLFSINGTKSNITPMWIQLSFWVGHQIRDIAQVWKGLTRATMFKFRCWVEKKLIANSVTAMKC